MKKNKDFFYLQYNKINWKNQDKTKINEYINEYIIQNIISSRNGKELSIFDIGLGIGFFIEMVCKNMADKFESIIIEGCEPSVVNYKHFLKKRVKLLKPNISINTYEKKFLDTVTETKFDFVTAIYVFPHFLIEELEVVAQKIFSLLKEKGQFILVLANESYLKEKLDTEKDLFIESSSVIFGGKKYNEVLHYSDIPQIGKVIDYNREERFYLDLFSKNGFILKKREVLDDNGFICTLFVFEK